MSQDKKVNHYLTLVISGEEFGIGIEHVREIVRHTELTRLPGAPEPVRGVTNLHGLVVPVVDLARKFRLGECVPGVTTCFVILEITIGGEKKPIGIIADEVIRVIDVSDADVDAPPSFGTPVSPEALIGLMRSGPRYTLLLDIGRVLANLEIEPAVTDDGSSTETWMQRPAAEATTGAR